MCDCGCEGIQSTSTKGADGVDGKNNYELAVASGEFTGTLAQYLLSLHGQDGKSAYDLWLETGNTGTMEEFMDSLYGTNGTNGIDGQPAWTTLTSLNPLTPPSFVQPAIGQTVLVTVNNSQWLGQGVPVHLGGNPGNWYIVSAAAGIGVVLRNPGVNDGYPFGISSNAAPGTVVTDTLLTARGKDGHDGQDGTSVVGPVGPVGPSVGVFVGIPASPPAPGATTTVLAADNPVAPTYVKYYHWNGATWQVAADVTPKAGSKILFLSGDPNAQPSSYGADTDVCMDTSVANTVKIWQRLSPGTWAAMGTITGGSGSVVSDLFRVGKTVSQPIPTGSTTPTSVQFELQSGGSYFNGGSWSGNKYTASHALATPTTFRLETVRIYTDAVAGEAVVFTVAIKVNGSTVASDTLTLTSGDTEKKLSLLLYTASTMASGDTVEVTVTPSVNPTVRWNIDSIGLVFYNQR